MRRIFAKRRNVEIVRRKRTMEKSFIKKLKSMIDNISEDEDNEIIEKDL